MPWSFWIWDNGEVQKLNPECNTPLSEPFRTDQGLTLFLHIGHSYKINTLKLQVHAHHKSVLHLFEFKMALLFCHILHYFENSNGIIEADYQLHPPPQKREREIDK
jgi:hypothetical protein